MSHVICDIAVLMGPWKAKSHFLCTISSQAKELSYDNGNPPMFNAPWYGKTGVSLHGQAEATATATMMGMPSLRDECSKNERLRFCGIVNHT